MKFLIVRFLKVLTDCKADLIDIDDLAATPTQPLVESKGRSGGKSKKVDSSHFSSPLDVKATDSGSQSDQGLVTPMEGMSARQLNVLKRKAKASKLAVAQKYVSWTNGPDGI